MTASSPAIFRIIATARSGALDHAWQMFRAAGFDGIDDDPAILNLKGRLLKDEALLAGGAARREKARRAGDAYAASAARQPAPYPLINAATLALIAGDRAESVSRADEALSLIAQGVPDETPYWLTATEAEALLLKGDEAGAKAALTRAIAAAPQAWEDHASTLRQFAAILRERGGDAGWLDPLRPPRSLHYTGHLALSLPEAEIVPRIDRILAAEGIGFGYGALAAGADIIVAERLLARGAELNLILPLDVAGFVERSVRPHGEQWVRRFDRALDAAAQTIIVDEAKDAGDGGFALLVGLTDLVATGRAVMNAAALQSEAVQLVIGPVACPPGQPPSPGQSARSAGLWRRAGRRQHIIASARTDSPVAPPADRLHLVAILAVVPGAQDAPRLAALAGADALLAAAAPLLAAAPPAAPPRWSSSRLLLAWRDPAEALRTGLALRAAAPGPVRLGLHIGIVTEIGGTGIGSTGIGATPGTDTILAGPAFEFAERIAELAGPDTLLASGTFAAAARGVGSEGARMEFIGELPGSADREDMELYSVMAPGA
ncbi:TRAFs-binding domain-containing protein [Sphingomonas sanxanigenens]|uniref:Uncharacterized protein n=1 Tax=Sphingomonas sanxanigenens DSM 19645 = NX02 TaxID=1123269 RepID=W0A9N7_9SPHN|nr:TRAFs-binding domain-containing protein [Sphingomonas sanxanigenens]AHE52390.1 hypothetical protein NX02_03180 [Sphingomonas sanxanigenens DSM 19645 = NX02]